MGCDRDSADKPKTLSSDYDTPSETPGPAEPDRRAQLAKALEHARQKRSSPAPVISLPNYAAGPLNPVPLERNFYEVYERYPGCLLCTYDVDEPAYSSAKEPERLMQALKQVRELGPTKFPPIDKVAVIIKNRAENKDAATFAVSHKVGAVYSARDVFNGALDVRTVVGRSALDHSPLDLQPNASASEGFERRWTVIERTQGR